MKKDLNTEFELFTPKLGLLILNSQKNPWNFCKFFFGFFLFIFLRVRRFFPMNNPSAKYQLFPRRGPDGDT